MKIFRVLVMLAFVLGGIALLCVPSRGQTAKSFAPTRFTITDAGTVGKPDVVLIPGLASSKAVWDGEAKLLAPNYRLHIVQIDGFAGAPAGPNATGAFLAPVVEELHAYIVANKIHPTVMGHSLGGLLTLMLADKHPEDVSKLIIVDSLPFYAVVFNPAATVDTVKPQADAIRQQLIAAPAAQFAAMQPLMVAGMVKNADGQKLVVASSIASDRTVFANAMYEDLQTDLRGDVATIKTPMLMLYPYDATAQGADPAKVDTIYTTAYAAKPNVKLVRIDDSRHFIMYDQPEKLDAAVESFLK
ncbi:alpha/beta fold hydrolase [Granulicella mallensis]|uniref:Alpha/beta hydrolase fold protein n=1 Tax=Granulicella mallensis (strain ATCC BAA-1857 / DSM 23137 / MP5ACTX8) TaxID=682795 RepID=G8NW03_GRAMM|nr:alpha/beta hydrolase [Granulicella mallensis]AEU35423.1 alpha/beta hydrolase fold protein [Granulicella mallensis MP5ACTX8]